MIITVSNRRFATVIRELEGLDSDTTDAEISENGFRYGQRLGQHLREYGISLAGLVGQRNGEIYDFLATLTSNDREITVRGLQILQPLNISVLYEDLPRL